MNPYNLVKEFVTKFERPIGFDDKNLDLSIKLVEEEYAEVIDEVGELDSEGILEKLYNSNFIDKVKLTEELADLQYVINFAAVVLELPLNEVFEEKHKANMTKLGDDGKPILNGYGKILKGPNYQKPDYKRFFNVEA